MVRTYTMYAVLVAPTPGACPVVTITFARLRDAQTYAEWRAEQRRDLRWQDVRIEAHSVRRIGDRCETIGEEFLEYAGPCR